MNKDRETLKDFYANCLKEGFSYNQIENYALKNGYSIEDIYYFKKNDLKKKIIFSTIIFIIIIIFFTVLFFYYELVKVLFYFYLGLVFLIFVITHGPALRDYFEESGESEEYQKNKTLIYGSLFIPFIGGTGRLSLIFSSGATLFKEEFGGYQLYFKNLKYYLKKRWFLVVLLILIYHGTVGLVVYHLLLR